VLDPTFIFSEYKQQTYTIDSGIYANYHVLSISFQAKRISTMSSIFLIFPLCIVCLALCLVLNQDPEKDSRLLVPASCITMTMYFSFVVSNMCPPVSYITRLHLLIFQTYVFAIVELAFNYHLWRIQAARRELAANNASNKNLLNDAHWMPRKILPPPTMCVVLPDGVYKPAVESVLEEKDKVELQTKYVEANKRDIEEVKTATTHIEEEVEANSMAGNNFDHKIEGSSSISPSSMRAEEINFIPIRPDLPNLRDFQDFSETSQSHDLPNFPSIESIPADISFKAAEEQTPTDVAAKIVPAEQPQMGGSSASLLFRSSYLRPSEKIAADNALETGMAQQPEIVGSSAGLSLPYSGSPPFRILFPPTYVEAQSHASWNMPPSMSPSPRLTSMRSSSRQIRSLSADMVMLVQSPAGADQSIEPYPDRGREVPSSPPQSLREMSIQSIRQVRSISPGAMMPESTISQNIVPIPLQSMPPPLTNGPNIGQEHSISLDAAIIVESMSLRDIARTFVAGKRFGNDCGDGVDAEKLKCTNMMAYPDDTGDLPCSPHSSGVSHIQSFSADIAVANEQPIEGKAWSTVAGARFGEDISGSFFSRSTEFLMRAVTFKKGKSVAGAAKKAKSAESGAFPDKTGELKDVMDLLDSAEVKTYKKLRWAGPDARLYRGMIKVLL
jgi:hypothetical protein